MEHGGQWMSLMEYATRNDVSLSTLRRHIKANKVQYRSENGRYLIWNGAKSNSESVEELRTQLQKAREEIAELKTLVAFYEDQSESPRVTI